MEIEATPQESFYFMLLRYVRQNITIVGVPDQIKEQVYATVSTWTRLLRWPLPRWFCAGRHDKGIEANLA
jgi:hypothetical protein